MSDPSNPAAPAPGARPSSVTISSYLLFAVAALQVINVILSLAYVGKIQEVYRELYAGTAAEGAEAFAMIAGVVGSVVYLLIAIGVVVLGVLNNRGKNAARISTWVIGGIGVCCLGVNAGGSALSSSMTGGGPDMPSGAEIERRLSEVLPSWYGPVTITIMVLSLLALLAALILLALPPSNEFFRAPQPGYGHPLPGGAYPGYPQAPEQPQEPGPLSDRGDQPPSA